MKPIYIRTLLAWLLLRMSVTVFSQGKILIVGGGTENYNDWSNLPYTWAVNQSANKKVAVVSYTSESTWLPNYFISLGAVAAKNFVINSVSVANSQATYDSLMAYDVIFFRGGDQRNYYLTYKNTKTRDAITDKFNNGGVIAGTSAGLAILSGVIYTAEGSTAYPDDCLKNIFHSSITLKNDFLQIMPGYLFDSHFIERGRLTRLLAFMARWKNDYHEDLIGVGVDDMTAFGIDRTNPQNTMGYAWGTAAVNIYRGGELGHQNNKLYCKDVSSTQLLHGCSINLNTFEVAGFNSQMSVQNTNETGDYTLLLSGSDPVSENAEFINHLVSSVGVPSDPILIFTGSSTTLANSYMQAFLNAGATTVNVGQAISANLNNPALEAMINQAEKFVFIGNTYQTLYDFVLAASGNGLLLKQRIKATDAKVAFVGDNSRMAGVQTVSDNYITNSGASFYGQLSFNPGLNLLSTMVIIPNTYLYSTTYYENTTSALPYGILSRQVYRGVWLTVKNFMKYYKDGTESFIKVYGESPGMVLTSRQNAFDLNAQLFRNRQVGGFNDFDFATLLYPNVLKVGEGFTGIPVVSDPIPVQAYFDPLNRQIILNINSILSQNMVCEIYNTNAQLVHSELFTLKNGQNHFRMESSSLENGIYLLRLNPGNSFVSMKILLGF